MVCCLRELAGTPGAAALSSQTHRTRIHAAQVAQRGKAVAHVLAGEAERLQGLGRGGLERLLREVPGLHREVDGSMNPGLTV